VIVSYLLARDQFSIGCVASAIGIELMHKLVKGQPRAARDRNQTDTWRTVLST